MEFPWDVAITAISTLTAAVGGALLAERAARRQERVRWRLDRQTQVADDLLAAGVGVYAALRGVLRDGQPYASIDWIPWNLALDRLSVVADPTLAEAARRWDAETWQISMAARRLDGTPDASFQALSEPFKQARLTFVNEARRVLGAAESVPATIARPPLTNELVSLEYWKATADRLHATVREDLFLDGVFHVSAGRMDDAPNKHRRANESADG